MEVKEVLKKKGTIGFVKTFLESISFKLMGG